MLVEDLPVVKRKALSLVPLLVRSLVATTRLRDVRLALEPWRRVRMYGQMT